MPNFFPPRVTAHTSTIELNSTIAFTDLFTVDDLDSDSEVVLIRVRDGSAAAESSRIIYDGELQPANTIIEIPYADIHKLRYKSAFVIDNEAFTVQVFDGKYWSETSEARLYTVDANLFPPVLTATPFSVLSTEASNVSEALVATDVDGYPMTKFAVVDRSFNSNGGFFSLRGVRLASAAWHTILAEDMPFLKYIGGQIGQTEELAFRSFDGRFWSNIAEIDVETTPNLFRPGMTAANFEIGTDATILVKNLFNFTDPDGNTLKKLQVFDTGVLPNGGFFSVNGVRQAAGAWFTVEQPDFDNLFYNGAEQPDSERFRIKGFDGKFWSVNTSGLLETIATPDFVVTRTVSLDELESVAMPSVIIPVGAGPPVTKYEFIDLNGAFLAADTTGHLSSGGLRLDPYIVHEISDAQFGTLSFVGGSADNGREFDTVAFRAYAGSSWNDWSVIDFNTDAVGARALDWGGDWSTGPGTTTITYTFIDRIPFYYTDEDDEFNGNPRALTGLQKANVREAIAMFETMVDIDFVETTNFNLGDITFGLADDDEGVLGHAYGPFPEPDPLGAGPKAGDVWFNQLEEDIINMTPEGYLTIIHEMGHALGLQHPFDIPPLPEPTQNQRYSMMSYERPLVEGRAITPMLYDLVELQNDYGGNMNFNVGHDQIRLPQNFDSFQIIWDAGGTDTLNLTSHTTNNVIDIREGRLSSVGNVDQNVTVAYGTHIEFARGGSGTDMIFGNELDNKIWANRGNDTLEGFGGNDFLNGGIGSDTYVYRQGGGYDLINEDRNGGRDALNIHGFGDFDNLDDLSFRRLGKDLRVDLIVDGEGLGGITVKNMAWGGSRVERLRLFGADGSSITGTVDLKSIFDQSTEAHQQFRLTEFNGVYGIIAIPV